MTNLQFNRGAIDPSGCIGTAWELFKRNPGLYLAIGIVSLLLLSCIPFVNFFLMGPVMGGFAYVVLRDQRGEPVEFGMLFKGFEKFVPLMVVGLIEAIPGIIFQVIQWTVDFAPRTVGGTGGDTTFYQGTGGMPEPVMAGLAMGFLVVVLGFLVFQIIWNAAFIFAIPLVLETDIGVGEAIKLSLSAVFGNLGGIILLMILGALVALLGVIAFCVGILVAIPVVWAANVIAYRQVFPLLDDRFHTGPPPPTAYGSSFGQGI